MTNLTNFELIPSSDWLFTDSEPVKSSQMRAQEYAERDFKLENIEQRLEEYVRQWIARKLIENYGYAEANFSLAAPSESFVNLIVRDDAKTARAFVAANYFGAEDSDFAVAASALQHELDTSETVFFGLITDGSRLAFLLKNTAESPRTINNAADFPTLSELIFFADSGEQPLLPLINDKFYKLQQPAAEATSKIVVQKINSQTVLSAKPAKQRISLKNQIKFGVNRLLGDRKLTTTESRKSTNKSAFRFAFAFAAVVACFVFVWYSNSFGSRPILNAETAEINSQSGKPVLNATESLSKPSAKQPARVVPKDRRRQQSTAENAPPVSLSPIDATVMQIRSATKSAANKRQEAQNQVQQPAADAPKRSTTIEQPYYQSN